MPTFSPTHTPLNCIHPTHIKRHCHSTPSCPPFPEEERGSALGGQLVDTVRVSECGMHALLRSGQPYTALALAYMGQQLFLPRRQRDKSNESTKKQQRASRGQQARGTVTWPGQGPATQALYSRPSGPCAAPTPARGSHAAPLGPPHARAQDWGSQQRADAARGQVGDLPPPDALDHQWRRENEAETMWKTSERRGVGRRRLGRDPSGASVSGEREEEEAGSAGEGSRASVGAAAPRRWWPSRGGAAAPTHRPLRARAQPTSQYRAALLARPGVTRAEAGPMGGGGRVEGRDFFSLALSLLSFFFFFPPSF
ncbi:uncharacterized protein LOC110261387 [Sus scrofa]|uniref:uncharacterized protein LOC110261387 n=1 Tax=Sus scrofa TaxID=9823 RepID=UPI000A2B0B49|nr:uncharacterized protein LOC110261387 [Sus scrofa]